MKSSSERTLPASVSSSADASSSIPGAACQLTSTVSSAVGTGALAPLLSSVDTRPTTLWLPAEAAHRHEQADRQPGRDRAQIGDVELLAGREAAAERLDDVREREEVRDLHQPVGRAVEREPDAADER